MTASVNSPIAKMLQIDFIVKLLNKTNSIPFPVDTYIPTAIFFISRQLSRVLQASKSNENSFTF